MTHFHIPPAAITEAKNRLNRKEGLRGSVQVANKPMIERQCFVMPKAFTTVPNTGITHPLRGSDLENGQAIF